MPKQEQREGEGPGIVSSSYYDIWVTSYSKTCKWSLLGCQWQSCYHLWHTHFHHPISIHYGIILGCSILSLSPILVFPPYFFLLSPSDQSRWILRVYCVKNKAKIINHTDGWTGQCFIYSTILPRNAGAVRGWGFQGLPVASNSLVKSHGFLVSMTPTTKIRIAWHSHLAPTSTL